jgi:hypothetical protein
MSDLDPLDPSVSTVVLCPSDHPRGLVASLWLSQSLSSGLGGTALLRELRPTGPFEPVPTHK